MRTIASVITAAAILSGGASIIVTAQTSAHVVQTPEAALDRRHAQGDLPAAAHWLPA